MNPIKNYYLEPEEKIKARMEAVANQAKQGLAKGPEKEDIKKEKRSKSANDAHKKD
jgi:hypothetical protein